jgi:Head domain of trimeric autotransporter adhesin
MIYVDETANQGFWYYNGTVFTKVGGAAPFFKVSTTNANHIIYNSAVNNGKNFIINLDSLNYKGSGDEYRASFIPSKAATRIGDVDNKNWDIDSIGIGSFATGFNTKAKGVNATAMGESSSATKDASTAMGYSTIASGLISTAMGGTTTASGDYSTAMGNFTIATGLGSTAMGGNTIASALTSTAMGNNTKATGITSTAMGGGSTASGDYSTAMGNLTIASGNNSIAMGNSTKAKTFSETAIGNYNDTLLAVNATSFAADSNRVFTVGNGTANNARKTAFVIQQDGNVGINVRKPSEKLDIAGSIKIVDGTEGTGKVLTSDANGKASWITPTGGTPFFKVSTTDANHIIYNSAANYGKNFIINGDSVNYKPAMFNTEYKMFFYASKGAFRAGTVSTQNWDKDSLGTYSFAAGFNTKATGSSSTAMGYIAKATGYASTAMGQNTKASGYASTAMGQETQASGSASTAIGQLATASGNYSTAMGQETEASGSASTAIGQLATASGNNSTAMGYSTKASGQISTAMGESTKASGYASTAMGSGVTASGYISTAMGADATASGNYSTALGSYTKASGVGSTALGYSTTALGIYSTAMGDNTSASGSGSVAMGSFTKAKTLSETAIGNYNDTLLSVNATSFAADSNRVFTVGIGTADNARKTAFVIQQNGNVGVGERKPTSTLQVKGSYAENVTITTSTNYTLLDRDATILDNSTSTTSTTSYLLPDPSKCFGRKVNIKKINTANHGIALYCTNGSATTTIEATNGASGYIGAASTALASYTLQSDGAKWWIISKF